MSAGEGQAARGGSRNNDRGVGPRRTLKEVFGKTKKPKSVEKSFDKTNEFLRSFSPEMANKVDIYEKKLTEYQNRYRDHDLKSKIKSQANQVYYSRSKGAAERGDNIADTDDQFNFDLKVYTNHMRKVFSNKN